MGKVVWLDLPNPDKIDMSTGELPWENYTTFEGPTAKEDAIKYIKEHIDPNCDEEGRISIITEGNEEDI